MTDTAAARRAPAATAFAAMVIATIAGSATIPAAAEDGGNQGDFAREVDIGNGRRLFLECRGAGSPTVILESGYHDSSDLWSLADAHPPPVLARLAEMTRVCAYDRPGTLRYTDGPPRITARSTSVAMPRTAADVVSDLHALLAAAGVSGPYVLVAHSMGGIFARFYAQTYPDEVVGMVMVDAFPIELPELFGPQWEAYRDLLDNPAPQFAGDPAFERIDVQASVAEIRAAPPLLRMSLVVLTKGEPFTVPPDAKPVGFTFADLERLWPIGAEALVKLQPDAPHVIATGSDHYIQIHDPDLVAGMVRLVVERAGNEE